VSPIIVTLVILGLAVIAFMSNRVPMGIVALGVALSLWATGILTLNQALAGFGDPTVIFIATLFVVSEALDSTGVTAWAGQQVIGRGGTQRTQLLVMICALVAVLTALISVNGAVAALIPVVVVVAIRVGLAPSKMLMPLAFSAHAGSMLALTGTPVNIIVSEAAQEAGARSFGFFEFALVGLPLVLGTIGFIVAFGDRLLPSRAPSVLPQDVSDYARLLREQYDLPAGTELVGARQGSSEVIVAPRSELIGLHLFPGMTTPSGDLVVLGLQRGGVPVLGPEVRLRAGDTLLLRGTWEHLEQHTAGPAVVVVDDPADLRRSVPLGTGAKRAVAVLAAMVVLLATGVVPPAVAICTLAMILGQLISNTATVLIMAPIATALATDMGVSVLPFLMALTVAGAASFLTPVATAANTMVMEPGGYRFTDYWKLGLPLLVLFLAVAVLWVPLIWRF
jgi:di/tricarboxylate transporter